jgi:hypothetical protein
MKKLMRHYFSKLLVLAVVLMMVMSCGGKADAKGGNDVATSDSMTAQVAVGETSAEDDEFSKLPQAERDTLAVRLINEFYSHVPKDNEKWDEAVLRRYLAPGVLSVLKAKADSVKAEYKKEGAEFEQDYATWLLTCTDEEGMVALNRQTQAVADKDGHYTKLFTVGYWGDGMLSAKQLLTYTVGGRLDHLQITRIDGMSDEAVKDVWLQVEAREEGREIEAEMRENGELDEGDDE